MGAKDIGGQPAQAVPNQLIDYSLRTTGANTDFQSWVKSVFAHAVADYRATAIDFGAHIPGLNGVGPSLAGVSIDQEVMSLLAQIMTTDRRVKTVGEDFRQAGSVGPLGGPPALIPGSQLVKTTNAGLDAAPAKAGAKLASQYPTMDIQTLLANLQQHSDDPAFTAAFLNGLSPDQLKQLIEKYSFNGDSNPASYQTTIVATLASGFAGNLDPRTTGLITKYLAEIYTTNDNRGTAPNTLVVPLLSALAANPAAAGNFTKAVVANPEALKLFVNGIANTPAFDFNAGAEREDSRKLMLQVLGSGSATLDADQAKQLVTLLGDYLPTDVSNGDMKELLPYVSQVIGNCLALLAPPFPRTPGHDGELLVQWLQKNNKNLGFLDAYDTWITKSIEDADKRAEFMTSLGNDVLLEDVFALGDIIADIVAPEVAIPISVLIGAHVLFAQGEDKLGKEKFLELLKESHVPELSDLNGATPAGLAAADAELIDYVKGLEDSPAQQINVLLEYRLATATVLQLIASGKVKGPDVSGLGSDPAALAKAIIAIKAEGSQSELQGYSVDGIDLRFLILGFSVSPNLPKPPKLHATPGGR